MIFSIIIPVYNDFIGLCDTVESVLKQNNHLDETEIIIVDNDSGQDSWILLQNYVSKINKINIKLLQQNEIQSSYASRNLGILNASGKFMIFIDANLTFSDDLLEKLYLSLNNSKYKYFGINVQIDKNTTTVAGIYNYFRGFNVKDSINDFHYTPTCFLVIHHDVISSVGLFEGSLISGGDFEFGNRVYKNKIGQKYLGHIKAIHPPRETFGELIKKTKRIAIGYAQLANRFPDEYGFIINRSLKIKNYIPRNIFLYRKKCKEEGFNIGFMKLVWLSCIHIPINIYNQFTIRRNLD